MEDLIGLGKAAEKLMEVVASGAGVLYRPRAIRAEADARAYEAKVLGAAALEVDKAKAAHALALSIESRFAVAGADPELSARARQRLIQTELQRQRNVESIVLLAEESLPEEVSGEPVDDDWARALFRFGQDVSDAAIQQLWAKVLNGELTCPGTYSLRTLQVLSTMSKRDLESFRRLCTLANHQGVILLPPLVAQKEYDFPPRLGWLASLGLGDSVLSALHEVGLVSDPNGQDALMRQRSAPYIKEPEEPLRFRVSLPGCKATFTLGHRT